MQNAMMRFSCFVLEWENTFWAHLLQNIKILSLSWNLVPTLIRACRIQWWCSFFLFLIGNTLFGQFWSKKSKLSVEAEMWQLDWLKYAKFNDTFHFIFVVVIVLFFWVGVPFLGKFRPKMENCDFKLKFGTYTNSNMQYSMVIFFFCFFFVVFFFVFDRKYPFWANLVQKVKIISLSWNLVARLIRTCRIQRCCSLFWFLSGNTLFGQIWPKKSKLWV